MSTRGERPDSGASASLAEELGVNSERSTDAPSPPSVAVSAGTSALERQAAADPAAAAELTTLRSALADLQSQLGRSFELFERDRRMLGFEIHDGVVQDLTAALMYLQVGLADLQRRNVEVPKALADGERLVAGCIQETRRLMAGLQPPQLAASGLRAALEGLLEEIRDRGVPRIDLTFDRTIGALTPPLEITVYRIVQESLNNVWQHARASRAEVRIERQGGRLTVSVVDDGCGFDVAQAPRRHYGLLGIRERATLFSGRATVESRPGHGTKIEVELPLGPAPAPAA